MHMPELADALRANPAGADAPVAPVAPVASVAPVARPLAAADLPLLSRLAGEVLDLEPAQVEPWFDRLRETHHHLVPRLRAMLAEHQAPAHPSFLAVGPRAAPAEAFAARAGDVIGPYRLVRPLGRGGMASVWLAERPDGVVKRSVALKMPLVTLGSPAEVSRFERERDLLAMLEHPQIARLYDAGVTPAGQPFIVLEHVDGMPITEACDRRRLDVPARLRIFIEVLGAVAHAHKHLVVHRDIKPSNVFVDADGGVKLLDFGVAKLLVEPLQAAGPSPLTREAGCALTPSHAAPEQMDGRPISTATDVYALGVLLYELLTGALPHGDAAGSVAAALEAALHAEPMRPSLAAFDADTAARRGLTDPARLRALLAGDLDTIVLKALRKAPAERFASADAFADDLRRFLAHRPIAARPPTRLHRLRLFARRHRRVGFAGALGVAVAIGLGIAAWQQHSVGLAERARADSVRDFMLDFVGDAEPEESHPGGEVTGRQLVDRAVLRARTDFAQQPRLQGELLGELGRISAQLDEPEKGSGLLDEALALLEVHAPAGDPALNTTRSQRAARALQANDVAKARQLATAALAACISNHPECAKARAYASNVLSNISMREGQVAAALRLMQTSLTNAEVGFGARHRETAMTLLNLAVIQRSAGRLLEADASLARASAMSRSLTLRSADRVEMSRTRAILDLDLGRFESARSLLAELAAGVNSRREKMLQLRFLADALLALGEPMAALQQADAAIALATPAEVGNPRVLFARQARARAEGLLGAAADASVEMAQVHDGLVAAGYATGSLEVLRARRFHAELLARAGALESAQRELESVVADDARFLGGAGVEEAQALDLLGSVLRETKQAGAALALHARARTMLERTWPADHPGLQRNALYAEAARMQTDPSEAARRTFESTARRFVEPLPAGAAWRSVIARFLDPAHCRAAGGGQCALIL